MTTSSVRWCCDTPPPDHDGPPNRSRTRVQASCNAHSFDDKGESDHPWWEKPATLQWRALFASPVWSSNDGFVPIGNFVASDVWWGLALQQAYKPSVQTLSLLRTVWAQMEGLCVPGVTWAVVVAILYLPSRCHVRMYQSCACIVTRATAGTISCPSSLPVALS